MSAQEWPANDYAIGSFIQANIADNYLKYLTIQPTDQVLDIGCGNGAYTRKIVAKIPQGALLGIDASENMLKVAREEMDNYPNVSLEQEDVLTMTFENQFDFIVSFWCLQWCAFSIEKAFQAIYRALKPGGKILTLFPSGDDPFITSYRAVKASGEFPCLAGFKPPVDYKNLDHLQERMQALPFKRISIERPKHALPLPSLDVFRKFVNGIAFFHGQIPSDKIPMINEAMVSAYDRECQEKYQGEYWFNLSIYLIRAEK
ncbi:MULTISPECIES: class I SAM-dependent methyltransferase [unclassified Legionella]|uniref:class I SAM-dependent methyltransferase n=1 Tax=unclassified Legionella TaxID=2622702 RepID=UPI001E5D480D|nr:class I SAM-dependent methyltransferase [Legionella sp. 31fI33]MCC5015179.1 class I SAM-dependent methyltransferase [Legionella sp. 31fI33]